MNFSKKLIENVKFIENDQNGVLQKIYLLLQISSYNIETRIIRFVKTISIDSMITFLIFPLVFFLCAFFPFFPLFPGPPPFSPIYKTNHAQIQKSDHRVDRYGLYESNGISLIPVASKL